MSQRAERVALQIRRELAGLVPHAVKNPRVQVAALVTVTHVRVSEDLGLAHVLVSVVADEPQEVLRGLIQAAGFLRGELGRRLHTRRIPQLRFHLDDTDVRAGRVEALLREIHAEQAESAADGAAEGETIPTDEAAAPGQDSRSSEEDG